jgi:hypothetical protein
MREGWAKLRSSANFFSSGCAKVAELRKACEVVWLLRGRVGESDRERDRWDEFLVGEVLTDEDLDGERLGDLGSRRSELDRPKASKDDEGLFERFRRFGEELVVEARR